MGVLDAASHPDHVVWDPKPLPILRRLTEVAHHQRLFDQRLNTTKAGTDPGYLHAIDDISRLPPIGILDQKK